jgi:hypothetical protein
MLLTLLTLLTLLSLLNIVNQYMTIRARPITLHLCLLGDNTQKGKFKILDVQTR